ncbi:putative ATP-dependent RNA helicase DDX46 [Hypsibius exemplaris]|uniref:Probable ATP-dependent RNA helicase DDX46 n=1 Tax=Hypsibius exemplaris TaxID=2072580 RepID=A0A1W0WW94_HYPEX|nr:putative ATP-dependent RNA helicase DDX46 [Hypsibius exemplaris]
MPRLVSSTSLRDIKREDRLREDRDARYNESRRNGRRSRSRSNDRERGGGSGYRDSYRDSYSSRRRSRSRSPNDGRRPGQREANSARQPAAATVAPPPGTSSTSGTSLSSTTSGSGVGVLTTALDSDSFDKEAVMKGLEQQMLLHKQRIEKQQQQRKLGEKIAAVAAVAAAAKAQKWSLEEDDEEMEDVVVASAANGTGGAVKMEVEEEEDPLDAYMQSVDAQVKTIRKTDLARMQEGGTKKKTGESDQLKKDNSASVTFVNAVKGSHKLERKNDRGEVIEQDQDALEWSSEEEEEDLKTTMNNVANKQKKLVQTVDHKSIKYPPFKRNFYQEVPEIANMTDEEVKVYQAEMEGIKTRGNPPKPIKNWAQCGVSKKELDVLKKSGYAKPTPIQAQAIPAIMSGRDVIGIAKTGSGKTLAFLLPMFRHILDQPPLEEGEGPIALICAPTRELALQIHKEAKKFAKSMGLVSVCVYGGTGISEQIAELKKGAEIIVCTPGRMIEMLAANNGRVTNLRRTTYVVLDEADRMFDMGFEPQVMLIVDGVRPDRQTVLFSATFPRQMEALARKILVKPVEILVGGRSVVAKEVEQHVMVLSEDEKFFKLLELLGRYSPLGSTLIFVDKQEKADNLLKDLMKASYMVMALHGGIDQFDRDSTINDFKKGNVPVLVATSVAARGLDVKNLILVVNYDSPNHYEDYVHRCGRTGRAGNKGFAYTFLTTDQQRYSVDIVRALEASEAQVPPDLKLLFETYKARMAGEGKQVKGYGGFSGKGFQFDESEKTAAKEAKKAQKAALGLNDSDDEDEEGNIDQHIEDLFKSTRRVKDGGATAPGGVSMPVVIPGPAPTVVVVQPGGTVPDVAPPVMGVGIGGGAFIPVATPVYKVSKEAGKHLEAAKRAASKIAAAKAADPTKDSFQLATEAVMRGNTLGAPAVSKATIAAQLADRLNARLNYVAEEKPAEEVVVDKFKTFEEDLEINDFPQQARWRVTGRETLAQIAEYSDAFLSVKGTHILPGKEPAEGERKLYISIEAPTELSLSKARAEVTRYIKEELLRIAQQPVNRGRYKVV